MRASGAALEPALLLGDVRRLDTVLRAELLDRRREVVAHCALGENERGGDLGDARAVGGGGQVSRSRSVSGLFPSLSAAEARAGSTIRSPATARRMAVASALRARP